MVVLEDKEGKAITSVDRWTRPKREYQWKDGRSAKELAKAWLRSGEIAVPAEMLELLISVPQLAGIKIVRGTPEKVTVLPMRGEGRNHDLHLIGEVGSNLVTICVEAKADEPFGTETVYEYWKRAIGRRESGVKTGVPERINALLELVDRTNARLEDDPWGSIRYQLLTAVCGTILQAQSDGAQQAVLLVHEFQSKVTTPEKLVKNGKDFDQLASAIAGIPMTIDTGKLYGPFNVSGIDIYLGKAVTCLSTA